MTRRKMTQDVDNGCLLRKAPPVTVRVNASQLITKRDKDNGQMHSSLSTEHQMRRLHQVIVLHET